MANPNRILYKVSGESLASDGILYDRSEILRICGDIANLHESGVEVCVVVGGGNILRGRSVKEIGLGRLSGDYMGMLATVMNSLAMQSVLEEHFGRKVTVMSALSIDKACEPYNTRHALDCIDKGHIVIFGAGLGTPFFSTDTGAAIRAAEVGCGLFIKGTTVDGVYSEDPKVNPEALFHDKISYREAIDADLHFMDREAAILLMENNIKGIVFSIKANPSPLCDLFFKGVKHTLISNEE